jgi:hypothetical protein
MLAATRPIHAGTGRVEINLHTPHLQSITLVRFVGTGNGSAVVLLHRGFLVLLFLWAGYGKAVAADMVQPSPYIAAAEVVAIQLNGLQYNDTPQIDAGILQTWAFAHPRNRTITGPLPRFAAMLKGPGYSMMINHLSHQITPAQAGDGWQKFDVLMEAENGDVVHFSWVVEKVAHGPYQGCWMTVAVSAPRLAGQGS